MPQHLISQLIGLTCGEQRELGFGILEGIFGVEFHGHSCVPGPVPPALGKGGQGSRYGLDESLASAGSLELWLPALAAHHSHLLGVGRWVHNFSLENAVEVLVPDLFGMLSP